MRWLFLIVTLITTAVAQAGLDDFKKGPLIKQFGEHIDVADVQLPPDSEFKVAFDVASAASPGEVNQKFNSLARFINMHVAAGVNPANIHLALVVHGKASMELLDHDTFNKAFGTQNANKALLQTLMQHNVDIILCGQSAGAYDIEAEFLIEGVDMALSAMTAHAQLQQRGYTVNPF